VGCHGPGAGRLRLQADGRPCPYLAKGPQVPTAPGHGPAKGAGAPHSPGHPTTGACGRQEHQRHRSDDDRGGSAMLSFAWYH